MEDGIKWIKEGFKGGQWIELPTEAFENYVKHPLVRRMYLTDVGYYPRARHHDKIRKDGIAEYILIYCTEGCGTILVSGKKYILHANEAFCIPRFCPHHYFASEEDPWSILWVHFKGEDTRYFPLEEQKIIKLNTSNATNRMQFLFDLLFRVLGGSYTEGNFIYISQVLSLILAEIYDREKKDSLLLSNKQVTQVIRYMYEHIDENLKMEDLTSRFGMSKSYLNAIFQKYTQHAPMDFFIGIKIKKACRLLRTTDAYVYEVAQSLGYTDQYYFSRVFCKVVGISPKEYKNSDYIFDGK